MKKLLIENENDLHNICLELKNNDFLSIDTEFVHVKTFFPMLSLIQIGDKNNAIAIDMQKITNYDSINELFSNNNITFVFHAMSQDLIALNYANIVIPDKIFDTQIAGAFLGFGESISYAKLVKHFCDVELDKTARDTDWGIRPLAQIQIDYALDDVIWLHKVYGKLLKLAENENKLEWIKQEIACYTQEDRYTFTAHNAISRVKIRNHDPYILGIVSQLADLREHIAITRNISRKKMFKDDDLLYVAQKQPENHKDLKNLRMYSDKFIKMNQDEILLAIKTGLENPIHKKVYSISEQHLKEKAKMISSLIKSMLIVVSNNTNIATSTIARSDDMDKYAFDYLSALEKINNSKDNNTDMDQDTIHNYKTKYKFQTSWRYEVFGSLIDQLLNNEISLTIKDGIPKLCKIS